jgi:hypothetical protein
MVIPRATTSSTTQTTQPVYIAPELEEQMTGPSPPSSIQIVRCDMVVNGIHYYLQGVLTSQEDNESS